MPQLAPVNWLFLFFLFWFIVALSAALIWWSSKTEYTIEGINHQEEMTPPSTNLQTSQAKLWSW